MRGWAVRVEQGSHPPGAPASHPLAPGKSGWKGSLLCAFLTVYFQLRVCVFLVNYLRGVFIYYLRGSGESLVSALWMGSAARSFSFPPGGWLPAQPGRSGPGTGAAPACPSPAAATSLSLHPAVAATFPGGEGAGPPGPQCHSL